MSSAYQKLEHFFSKLHTLKSCISLFQWDTAVLLPVGGDKLRSEQLAYLQMLLYTQMRSKVLACNLDKAESNSAELNDWQQANLREMRDLWRLATAVPVKLHKQFSQQAVKTELKWRQAKQGNRYPLFIGPMDRMLDLVRAKATCYAEAFKVVPYHGLMLEYDRGIDFDSVEPLFADLDRSLPPLIKRILSVRSGVQATRFLGSGKMHYPKSMQQSLCKAVAVSLGFDFSYGRLDESTHPFTEGAPGDIRMTTRYDESNPLVALLGVLHETGHAIYDHNLPAAWQRQPVGRDCGMLVHEGIALFMEMMIGRSDAFSEYLKPIVQKHFKLKDYPGFVESQLTQHLLGVSMTPIRTDADVVGYMPHILLRYQLEKQLIDGTLEVKDLPEQWNSKLLHYFSMQPKDDREGCLQDVHWSLGLFGYFPSYALGLLWAAALYKQARVALVDLDNNIKQGDFSSLLSYLKKTVFSHGAYYTQAELIQRACGAPLSSQALLEYLQHRYSIEQ